MAHVALTVNTFVNPDGTPVANGYMMIRLNTNGSTSGGIQIQDNFTKTLLDANGTVTGSPLFWQNADISPAGSYYIYSIYTAKGQLVSGPNKLTL